MSDTKHGFWDFTKYRESDESGEGYLPDENGHYYHLARRARDNGWRHLVPIAPGSKACYQVGWDKWGRVEPTDAEIKSWTLGDPREGLGPYVGFGYAHNSSLVVIDLDLEDATDVNRRLDYLARNVPGTPLVRIGREPGCQLYYKAGQSAYGRQCGPEIFFQNKMTVLFGTHPITGRPFKWVGGSPATRKFIDVPEIYGPDLDGFLERFGHDRIPGKKGGIVMSIIKTRPQSLDPVMTLEEMAARIRQASKGMRHPTCQAMVSYAFSMHRVEDIANVLKPAFCGSFDPSERRNAEREFADMIRYAEKRTPRAIGGIDVGIG